MPESVTSSVLPLFEDRDERPSLVWCPCATSVHEVPWNVVVLVTVLSSRSATSGLKFRQLARQPTTSTPNNVGADPLTKKNVPIAKSIAYNVNKHIWFSLHHNVSTNASIQHPGRSRNVLLWSSWNRGSATPDVLFCGFVILHGCEHPSR
ncbi:hypothetical protein E4T42_05476 [Aureobasidium subglaciale]|nr:hypothetical protein E4T42_05476 [Aureobasidium subglaciale]